MRADDLRAQAAVMKQRALLAAALQRIQQTPVSGLQVPKCNAL
jgi:hypothetical protein